MFTPIHRALGREPSEPTYELLEAAVAAGVRESEDLDWKRELPQQSGEKDWHAKWAKDVAAIANSGGGCIVYGVAQDDSSNAARELHDVGQVTEAIENSLRSSAAQLISPMVARLQFIELVDAGSGRHALMVRIPSSPDAPHMLKPNRDTFQAPFRHGATTEWMTERDLERAYRRRFRRTADLADALDSLYEATDRHTAQLLSGEMGLGICVVVAAVPLEPRPEIEIRGDLAREILTSAHDLAYDIAGRERGNFYDLNTLPGLRRLVTAAPPSGGRLTELHFDGALTHIEKLSEGAAPEGYGGPAAPADEVEMAVVRFVATLAATARTGGEDGTYAVTIGMRWAHRAAGHPLRFARADRHIPDRYTLVEPVRMVHEVQPSTREVRADAGVEGLRASARTLALDLLRQGGLDDVSFIPRG